MPIHSKVEVRFSGGEHSGLVVEAPAELADRLPGMRFTVLASGQLFDLVEQCRMREVRVIRRAGEPPVAVAPLVPAQAAPAVVVPEPDPEPEPAPLVTVPVVPATPRMAAPGLPMFRSARTDQEPQTAP